MILKKKSSIYYGKQFIDFSDIQIVKKSLKQELITTGKFVEKFEDKIKKKINSKYVITCANATAGLHLAFISINLKKNDVVIMPSINFIAAYRMAKLLGAKIYLTDVDPFSGQMTPRNVIDCIKKNKIRNIKLILTMYLGGYPENIAEFNIIKKKYKCYLIEDSCHAFGAKYKFKNKLIPLGSCKHSDISVFSFHPVKPITTGEGGAITTNKNKIAKTIRLLRSHGIKKGKKYWDYDIKQLGFNYRLSDINCALGVGQIKKLPSFLSKRKKIHNFYTKKFLKYQNYIKIFKSDKNINSYHLILLSVNFKKLKNSKDHMINFLNKLNIFPQFHYKPIYKFSFYKKLKNEVFPGSEYFYKNNLSLPVYHSLNKKKQEKIINSIIKYIIKYKK